MSNQPWITRAGRRAQAFDKFSAKSVGTGYPKLVARFGSGKRETKVYETAKNRFRVYLFEYGYTIDSKVFLKKSAAVAKAKAWY